MLKKIIVCFLICLEAFAIQAPTKDDYKNFKKSLMLTPWQTRAIDAIELKIENKNKIHYENMKKAHKEYVELSQNCNNNYCFKRLPELREEMKNLNKNIYNNIKKRDELIIQELYPWQKDRYIEYRSRIY